MIENCVPFLPTEWKSQAVDEIIKELGNQGGVIIFILERENDENQLYYWHEYLGSIKFGTETVAEAPMVFHSKGTAIRELNRVRQEGYTAGLAIWWHPDSGNPLGKYEKMSGSRFPGCPTQ